MRFRWPFVLRSTHDATTHEATEATRARMAAYIAPVLEAAARRSDEVRRCREGIATRDAAIDDLSDEVRDCHEHIAALDAEIARLREQAASLLAESTRPISYAEVVPFWQGLPNEILSLIVTTNMDGVQATIGGLGHDEESDDPRCNPKLPFALKPL